MHASTKRFTLLILLYLLVQILLAQWIEVPFSSDSLRHYTIALDCARHGDFYPNSRFIHNDYIIAPLYINMLVLWYGVFSAPHSVFYLNILLNMLQLALVYRIARRLGGNSSVARSAALLYMLYLSSLGAVYFNLTEFLFGVLILGAILTTLNRSRGSQAASGFLTALAVNIRPIGLAWPLAHAVTAFLRRFKSRQPWPRPWLMPLSTLIVIVFIGLGIKHYYGQFIPWSDTGAVNILMGAYDEASGSYSARVFEKGQPGYLPPDTLLIHGEKGAFWRRRAVTWIKQHPLKWLALWPKKLLYMFALDDWSVYILTNSDRWNSYTLAKAWHQGRPLFKDASPAYVTGFVLLYLYHYLYYYLLLLLTAALIRHQWRNRMTDDSTTLLLFAFIGTGVTLTAVGLARYKYPYLVALLPALAHYMHRSDHPLLKKLARWTSL